MKRDGGPAFPLGSGDIRDPMGMTLRDYFAGQALIFMSRMDFSLFADDGATINTKIAASNAYELADAMLAERERE